MIMDAIASQYGWNDETILDLYLGRVNQIKDVIFIRQYNEMQTRHREIEWQTKTISSSVVAAAQGTPDSKNKMIAALNQLSLSDTNRDSVPDVVPGSSDRSVEDIIENGSVALALARNEGKQLSDLFSAG